MVRISGVNIPDNKQVVIALTYIHGIGKPSSQQILKSVNIPEDKRVKDLSESEVNAIRKEIESGFTVEADKKREVQINIKRLLEIGCYRGLRHRLSLPVRGQTSRRNARTRKGPKKTVANKKTTTK